ncbi:MAG: hypothetical protein R2940_16890 [Syntrophotaleaceae bacterium]
MAKRLSKVGLFFFVPLLLLSVGCSTLGPEQQRGSIIMAFLERPDRYALFSPTTLKSEDKLKFFGLQDAGETFSRELHLGWPVVGLMESFLSFTPGLACTRIVESADARGLPLGQEEFVLYFYSDWWLIYRRLPPDFFENQLQVGVIAKMIPLGQVLAGKGPIAFKTAAWEGKCHYKAFDGEFFNLEEWAAADGSRLRQGIRAAQDFCAEKLSREFAEELSSLGFANIQNE